MNERNKLWMALALGLVVIVGAIVLAVTRDGGSDRGANENTYVSNEYNFSFEYPLNYDLLEAAGTDSNRYSIVLARMDNNPVPQNGEGSTAITVDIFDNPSSTNAEEWVKGEMASNFNIATSGLEETTVDGIPALTYEWDGLYRGRSVAVSHDGSIILISGTYLEQSDPIYADFDEVVDSFELE
jgi:hypothetical protein